MAPNDNYLPPMRPDPLPADWFIVGDIVSRTGDGDQHEVVATNERAGDPYPPDLIDVVCVKAPASGWCRVGWREANIPGRYDLVRRRSGFTSAIRP